MELKATKHHWLRVRLRQRAKDARQAQKSVENLHGGGYPDAKYLAEIHGKAADIYEQALAALDAEHDNDDTTQVVVAKSYVP